MQGNFGVKWNERWKTVDPLSMPLEVKYTSRNKGPYTRHAMLKSRWQDSALTEESCSNLISLKNTLATHARVGKPEEAHALSLWQKGHVYRGTDQEGWGVQGAGRVHMQKLEQTNAGDTQSGRAGWLGDTLRTPWYHVPRGRTNLAEQVGYERGKGHYLFSRLIQLPSIPGLFRYIFFYTNWWNKSRLNIGTREIWTFFSDYTAYMFHWLRGVNNYYYRWEKPKSIFSFAVSVVLICSKVCIVNIHHY